MAHLESAESVITGAQREVPRARSLRFCRIEALLFESVGILLPPHPTTMLVRARTAVQHRRAMVNRGRSARQGWAGSSASVPIPVRAWVRP